jgi:alpha-beta hydrolase superfamily lysophospholipase
MTRVDHRETVHIDGGAGWDLALHRYSAPGVTPRPGTRPVLMIPGYAMNSFILGYHPTSLSLAHTLAARGLEVWSADLRGQGLARARGLRARLRPFGMADIALSDVTSVVDAVLARTGTGADRVDAVGCSLGATYMFMQAAWNPATRFARLVNVGGPLRWDEVGPAAKALSMLPEPVLALGRVKGTRALARHGLPVLARVPALLRIYMNPAICDLSDPGALVNTVDDPIPRVNVEIARWVRARDFIHRGRNLTEDVRGLDMPLLTVVANADGIVPEGTVMSGHHAIGSDHRAVIIAGDPATPMAHADLFISEPAPEAFFEPLAEWLLAE